MFYSFFNCPNNEYFKNVKIVFLGSRFGVQHLLQVFENKLEQKYSFQIIFQTENVTRDTVLITYRKFLGNTYDILYKHVTLGH